MSDSNVFTYYPSIPEELRVNDEAFDELWNMCPTTDQTVVLFGKKIVIPRKQQSYGISYRFSGTLNEAIPIPPIIQKYIDYMNKTETETKYNMALVNWYKDGNDYIGYHSDDVRQLVPNSPIACFSFMKEGGKRDFLLKEKTTNNVTKISLANN